MCGIVGFVSKEKSKKQVIKKMADRIKHRGPDGEGYYTDEYVALGHRRLSIIDLATGNQPMFNEDDTKVIVFNGEIYNYVELRDELKKEGHTFKTSSDTEVLIHGYEEWGSDLPKKLRGMFAFAIWDKDNEILFCSRDNFGIKPFYYYQNEDTFLFGSEIKSFLEYPTFQKELNKQLIGPYLSFSFTPTSETFFKGVYRLDPGCSLTYQNGKLEIKRYYDIQFEPKEHNFSELVETINKTMKDSVSYHMLSDVEVGSFLSSGIDSSYIVSLARPDKTYTVGYDNPKYNEIEYAKDLANKLKIKNSSKKITKEEYKNIIPKVLYHMDEPSSDPASIMLYFVSELASHDVKVVLSGEGADEFFGGYNNYREEVDLKWYNKIPYPIRHLASVIFNILPEFPGRNFIVRRGSKLENDYIGVNKVFSEKERKKVLTCEDNIKNKEITKPIFASVKNADNITKKQAVDIHFWLIKDILQKADRMTMANSIEGRVPFIDKEVFKVASNLTEKEKVTKENTKVALREAAKKEIPNESYKKKKLGFPVPLREWLREDDFYNEVKNTILQDFVSEFFNQDYLIKLLDEHKNYKKDTYKKVWTVYCFIKWYEIFFLDKEYTVL